MTFGTRERRGTGYYTLPVASQVSRCAIIVLDAPSLHDKTNNNVFHLPRGFPSLRLGPRNWMLACHSSSLTFPAILKARIYSDHSRLPSFSRCFFAARVRYKSCCANSPFTSLSLCLFALLLLLWRWSVAPNRIIPESQDCGLLSSTALLMAFRCVGGQNPVIIFPRGNRLSQIPSLKTLDSACGAFELEGKKENPKKCCWKN